MTTRTEMLSDRELARSLTARLATSVPIRRFIPWPAGWQPRPGDCHRNVELWISKHAGWRILRGWIVNYVGSDSSTNYASHSVVVDANGELWDVTTNDVEARRFLAHIGSIDEYLVNVDARRWAQISDA